ncbi:MAG: 4'-phosphopantetheinyl transferase superfamily protein [Desulfobacteraceae bacterium]|nr:4'-phosphopantetheinyl transferase superfamily protein [Desulfobacteraceae bacterium]MBC2757561.1 4'-phosphopantetheinyl transferase superfamily protein [Desulfobacteraceae bacterium]
MIHVGNDIVDLKTPEAMGKATDIRFMQRVLNSDEQQVVLNSDHADSFLWAFWAAKESAYKAVSKSYPDVSSAPRRYPVRFDSGKVSSTLSGIVKTPHGTVPVKIFFNEDYVHCIGIDKCSEDLEKVVFGLKEIEPDTQPGSYSLPERESIMVRRLSKERIASLLGRNSNDIHIMRNKCSSGQGPPTVYYRGEKDNIDISLSHDGRFAAYAFWAV